jgi:DNA polymerase III delta prime subunit
MFASVGELGERLRCAGYIADPIAITTVFLSSQLKKPLLLEGPAGSGKTQIAYAIAQAAGTRVERLQCYEGVNEEKAIGKFDEALQRLSIELQSKAAIPDWRLLQAELHHQQFFSAGPLVRALQCDKPCVLLVDELDKVDHAFEAQAFKRASSCFGLGRYLYYFDGVWVDLDERKRPKTIPQLPEWATPRGWAQGLRPDASRSSNLTNSAAATPDDGAQTSSLVKEIESMAGPLGRGLYRGLLRDLARVWNPHEIWDVCLQQRVLEHMRSAKRGLRRLEAALDKLGPEALIPVLKEHMLTSIERVDSLESLKRIVLELERRAETRS